MQTNTSATNPSAIIRGATRATADVRAASAGRPANGVLVATPDSTPSASRIDAFCFEVIAACSRDPAASGNERVQGPVRRGGRLR
jgi:hypothetical protein